MKLMALRNSLFAKIILTAGAVLLLGMGVGGWFSVHDQATSNMKHALESADRLTNTIRLGAHYAMMGNLRDDIASIITNTSLQEGIEHVRIFNKMGEIKYSNILAEVDTRTHIRDEACSVCHHTEPPLATLSLMERSRIFTGPDGIRRLGLIAPIYNTPGCSPGPCHVHPTDKKVLGLLDVVVTLGATDARRNEFLHRTILLDATVFLATFLAIFLLVHTMVNRPIQKLIRQTRRIAQGEISESADITQTDEVGQLAQAMNVMVRDIRTQHAEINRQKENYQRLFELVPCIITVQDRDLRLVSYNREFEVKFAPKPGQHCYEVYKGRREKCPNCPVEKTFATGRSYASEETGYCQSGDQAHWIVTTSPVTDSGGNIVAAMEVCLDITPRKELERTQARYRAIFDTIPNPVFLLDTTNYDVVDCNDAVEEVYGVKKAAMIGRPFLNFFPEEEREHYRRRLARTVSIEQAKQVRPDGLPFYVQIRTTTTPEFEQSGALLITVQDITKRLETEQQLIQAGKMATLGEMATGVAHELNQPLSVIKTASSFLMGKINKNEPIREDILMTLAREIDAHVDRATKIIRHMREFGRKPEISLEPVDVGAVLERGFEIFSQQLKLRQIEVVWNLTPGLPPVMADAGRLEQVFINLLINARDAIEEKCQNILDGGPKRIDLATRLDGDWVVVEVSDTGLGIPNGLREKIFEPFFTTKKVGKGTGLGLSISYGIIQDCGGTISVANRKTGGARFTILLPAIRNHE